MNTSSSDSRASQKPIRLWPGAVVAALMLAFWIGATFVVPESKFYGVFGLLIGGLLILLWWLFFSRAPWLDRLLALVVMVLAIIATRRFLHPSIATAGMGFLFYIFVTPAMCLALVGWAAATRRVSIGARRASMAAAMLLAGGFFTLLRTGGISGEGDSDIHWRWTPTPEERLLAQSGNQPLAPAPVPPVAEPPKEQPAAPAGEMPATKPLPAAPAAEVKTAEWPGFRGPNRNSVIPGVRIATNWSAAPPKELWRRPIGPGWASFAVHGNLIFTQEQRGDDEVVACYNLKTGEPVWLHRDAARFWESNAGAGPRATPTLSNGRVYTLGATGIVNVLDAATGAVVWTRNAVADTGAKIPPWGLASSPLVYEDLVVVATAGALVAYEIATGAPRWYGPKGGWGYSSPHLATIDGVAQVLLLNGAGVISVAPADGALLWEHKWPGDGIVQPGLTPQGDILLGSSTGMGSGAQIGMRSIAVTREAGEWKVRERWTSLGLKPYYNDFVVHNGHAFGFDGSILACVDLADGKRKWKGGRYGYGQLVLLPEQDLLLVLTENGELALVSARTDQHTELARFPAIEGKTWNHPVLVGDILLVRNAEEMAAFRLPLAAASARRQAHHDSSFASRSN
jgi:outer membrane protein assembly factor BamB